MKIESLAINTASFRFELWSESDPQKQMFSSKCIRDNKQAEDRVSRQFTLNCTKYFLRRHKNTTLINIIARQQLENQTQLLAPPASQSRQ